MASQEELNYRNELADAAARAENEKYLNNGDTRKNLSPEKQAADLEEKKKIYRARMAEGDPNAPGVGEGARTYIDPGSAEYGRYGADMFYQQAMNRQSDNNESQAATNDRMQAALAGMKGVGGSSNKENALLSQREQMSRGDQTGALNLLGQAAAGNAPSASAYQTQIGMNDIGSQMAAAAGGARNASALNGAQRGGGATAGQSAGNLAMQGGLGRSKEIGEAIGLYGSTAGQQRGQDLTRLGMSNQNSQFNATLNDEWKLGQAGIAVGAGKLGMGQDQADAGWLAAAQDPILKQFQMDQESQAWQAGADVDKAANQVARDRDNRQQQQALVGGITTAGLTAAGTAVGGPLGGAAGGLAGSAINSATRKYY